MNKNYQQIKLAGVIIIYRGRVIAYKNRGGRAIQNKLVRNGKIIFIENIVWKNMENSLEKIIVAGN